MEKNRKVLIFVILIAIIGLVGFGFYSISNYSKAAPEEEEEVVEEEVEEPQTTMSHTEILQSNLIDIGEDIYKNKEYMIDLYLSQNGAYFITVNQLRDNFSYDVSSIVAEDGTACDLEFSGIFIDPNGKMEGPYQRDGVPVIPVIEGC